MINQLKFKKIDQNKKQIFCALCRAPRELKQSSELSILNYAQLILLSSLITYFTYDVISLKGMISIIPMWAIFEFVKKSLYRKELTCPTCGFDPTWYRRDVKMAREKVKNFIEGQKEKQLG